jgi:hypothetical protein
MRCFEKESKFFKDGTRRRGKLLPAEAFLLIAENSLAMATRYQPELTNRETGEKQPNPNYNEGTPSICRCHSTKVFLNHA